MSAQSPGEFPDRRLLLVHAHPDDETISNGATMAKYVADGAHVTLVTCTRGEEGEVLVPDLAHLASDRDDTLGEQRVGELAVAMAALGVTDHRFLGGAGRYRDTGMVWTEDGQAAAVPPQPRDDTFWRADLREAATYLVAVLREVRPQVVIAYDDFGQYGHPDHVQAHRVATYAVALAAAPSYRVDLGPAWDVPKVYWTAMPKSAIAQGIELAKAAGTDFFGIESPDDFPMVVPDEQVTARIDGNAFAAAKKAAMLAHATQITPDGPFFAMEEVAGADSFLGLEFYRLVKGAPGPVAEDGFEEDLFAGVVGA